MFRVTIAPEVIAEVVKIATWWNENRVLAPRLFQNELDAALLRIAASPAIGTRARLRGRVGLRAIVLKKTNYIVVYEVNAETEEVTVVRVRHGHRRPLKSAPRRRPR